LWVSELRAVRSIPRRRIPAAPSVLLDSPMIYDQCQQQTSTKKYENNVNIDAKKVFPWACAEGSDEI
jgi:hypothetical protein